MTIFLKLCHRFGNKRPWMEDTQRVNELYSWTQVQGLLHNQACSSPTLGVVASGSQFSDLQCPVLEPYAGIMGCQVTMQFELIQQKLHLLPLSSFYYVVFYFHTLQNSKTNDCTCLWREIPHAIVTSMTLKWIHTCKYFCTVQKQGCKKGLQLLFHTCTIPWKVSYSKESMSFYLFSLILLFHVQLHL